MTDPVLSARLNACIRRDKYRQDKNKPVTEVFREMVEIIDQRRLELSTQQQTCPTCARRTNISPTVEPNLHRFNQDEYTLSSSGSTSTSSSSTRTSSSSTRTDSSTGTSPSRGTTSSSDSSFDESDI